MHKFKNTMSDKNKITVKFMRLPYDGTHKINPLVFESSSSLFTSLTDHIDKLTQSGLVHRLSSHGCNSVYIGERCNLKKSSISNYII